MRSIKKLTLLLIFFFFSFITINAQCLLVPVSLRERAQKARMIVEGRVASGQAFIDAISGNIYTRYRIEVYTLFKGTLPDGLTNVEIITQGGTVGERQDIVSPSTEIYTGNKGIFFIEEDPVLSRYWQKPVNRLYAGPQGLITYDATASSASDVFTRYPDVKADLHEQLIFYLNAQPLIVRNNQTPEPQSDAIAAQAPAITSFAPASVSAGTGTILTISGTGFGAIQGSGSVQFENSNTGGGSFIAALPAQYLIWTDIQIQVEVPSNAGTGNIRVVTNSGQAATSLTDLTVRFAQLNVELSADAYMPDMIDDNGQGGYTLRFHNEVAQNAQDAFARALVSWRCNTFVNFSLGLNTSVDASAGDGINVIRFDNGAELPSGVLGITVSRWNGCSGSIWYLGEVDMTYDDGVNFNFGPTLSLPGQFDFESVVLHELGHAHQLGHVINNTAVMHYAISSGSNKRALTASELEGGNYLMTQSEYPNPCGPGPMEAVSPGNCSTSAFVGSKNPEKDMWVYPGQTEQYLDVMAPGGHYNVQVINMLGRMMLEDEADIKTREPLTLDLGRFDNGTYIIRLSSGENMYISIFQVLR